ncbi:hypothetical protein GF420_03435 [candidate division GN15 bacterium]|nr:hypothetical protein [candidate division GN15 bacterium]
MSDSRARTPQDIFTAMHRELRSFNRDIPESLDRLDPILKLLMQLYASQLSHIDKRVDHLWDVATAALIKSLYPEAKRWPVPAYTVMHCAPLDPVVETDRQVRFFFQETREGGQMHFFSPQRTEKLINATVKRVLLRSGEQIYDLTPGKADAMNSGGISWAERNSIYVAVEYGGNPADMTGSHLFLDGDIAALRQLRWGYWYPSSAAGGFYDDSRFCPALRFDLESLVSPDDSPSTNWGGLRDSSHLFSRLENHFVTLPEAFCATWQMGPPEPDLARLLGINGIIIDDGAEQHYWLRIDLPPSGDKSTLARPIDLRFGCVVVTNRNELTLFKHTGDNRLIEIELPDELDSILGITSVTDSTGKTYQPRHQVQSEPVQTSYALEERDGKLVVWFDFTSSMEAPPESLTVTYAVTSGTAANGIGRGEISDLYENHPGIDSAENVLPTTGAVPAKTEQEIIDEVTLRLRARDRALSFPELARWAQTFDKRIKSATCENGIQRTPTGIRRCIDISVAITKEDFCSDDEINLLADRLERFLKSRAPVNTQFQVKAQSA